MTLTKLGDFFKPEEFHDAVHIVGCGSVGSTLAEHLARYGIQRFVLYDFDKVESKNIHNQIFFQHSVGLPKTHEVEKLIKDVNQEAQVKKFDNGWTGQNMTGYVFLCVDSIEIRKQIVAQLKGNMLVKGVFDVRTGMKDAQSYATDWHDQKAVANLIRSMDFTSADVQTVTSACGTELNVVTTIRLICDLTVSNFINFVNHGTYHKYMESNIDPLSVTLV